MRKNSVLRICVTMSFLAVYTVTNAQLPEEIQWKHLVKNYNKDSTEMVLTLNNKPLQGKYKIPFEEGGFALYDIKNGMITGEAFWYSQTGNMECRLYYKRGVRHGTKENYDNSGRVWLKQDYKNGMQDGIDEMYSDGVLISKSTYKNGKKHGWHTSYSGDQVVTEAQYEHGLRNGMYRSYANGELVIEAAYKDDQRNGLYTMYTAGRKNMDFMYKDDKKHGVGHMYGPDGTVIFEHYYLSDERVTQKEFEAYSKQQE